MKLLSLAILPLLPLLTSAAERETVGSIKRHDAAMDELVAPDAEIEILTTGFSWAEGPAWDKEGQQILFTDVPNNVMYSWSEEDGRAVHMKPSGFDATEENPNGEGANGLAFDNEGHLLICEHGNRRISKVNDEGEKVTLTDNYQGQRYNSPNDLVVHSSGAIFFTDPPYGLAKQDNDPAKELEFSGVYRRNPDGEVALLDKELPRPNGIALSPDEKTLYVAQSDGRAPIVYSYPLNDELGVGERKVFFDTSEQAKEAPGAPDGVRTDIEGNVWTTGPGGVLVISPEGKLLGHILTESRTANLGWGGKDGQTLFLTSHRRLLALPTLTKWSEHSEKD
jgi:gluconolactonase